MGSRAWDALAEKASTPPSLRTLFAGDPARGTRLCAQAAGLHLDYSKNLVDDDTLARLLELAEEAQLPDRIRAGLMARHQSER